MGGAQSCSTPQSPHPLPGHPRLLLLLGSPLPLARIPQPVPIGWLFRCPRPWVVGAHPLSAGLAGLMSSPVSPSSAALTPPSLPGRLTSCCRPEPREHRELVALLSRPVPSASPAPQQPSLPAFTPHTCIHVPIKARIKPAPCPCLLGHRGGEPQWGDREGEARLVAVGQAGAGARGQG